MNVADARGLAFACLPGCGFCCAVAPLVLEREAGALGALVSRAEDGALRIPVRGTSGACSALGDDRGCTVYEARPGVCRQFPYQVHAGRRIQVTVSLACPGVADLRDRVDARTRGDASSSSPSLLLSPSPFRRGEESGSENAEEGARQAGEAALARPGAAELAASARASFAEFDRRMSEWGAAATSDQLRAAFLPELDRLARPEHLPAFLAGLAPGDLLLARRGAVGALFEAEPEAALEDALEEAARDAFDGNAAPLWVEPGFAWSAPRMKRDRVVVPRAEGAFEVAVADLPTSWDAEGGAVLAAHLTRLAHRDHTEGAAAWLVDASGYQATPAAAYGRVLAESALHIVLRAGLAAAEARSDEVDAALAWRGVRAYETSYHSLPTLGAIL